MMEKIQTAMWIVMSILIAGLVFLMVLTRLGFEEMAEEKCNEIGLDLFDYSSGNVFTQSSITCINKTTKELKKIR